MIAVDAYGAVYTNAKAEQTGTGLPSTWKGRKLQLSHAADAKGANRETAHCYLPVAGSRGAGYRTLTARRAAPSGP